MIRKLIPLLFLCILFNSCWVGMLFTKVEPCQEDYIKNNYQEYYWTNQRANLSYSYLVDSISGIDIFGKLIIGETDTLVTRSFEKSNDYPTWYKEDGFFFLESACSDNDTLMLALRNDTLRLQLKSALPLIRTKKASN